MARTGWRCDCIGCRIVRQVYVFMLGFFVGWIIMRNR